MNSNYNNNNNNLNENSINSDGMVLNIDIGAQTNALNVPLEHGLERKQLKKPQGLN